MNSSVIRAIFRRNLVSYFSNPTGYVFICVFVLLSGLAAFWPNEFFNANLANLDQLNRYLPYILLVFVPAITMSIWADERRQGTDELLLTIPATDLDVVMGKYLAAVAIYTISLAFSAVANIGVLNWLGQPDFGLLLSGYVGYWLVGLAMLAIGMTASFLTGNLTVGFVLGALFNAPLVFAGSADVILPGEWARGIKQWSLADQFRDFGHGVLSLSSFVYFGMIVVVMLYLCVVLIGRRHWRGGYDGQSLATHYAVRAIALGVLALSLVVLISRRDVRADASVEGLNSLSPETKKLLAEIKPDRPVLIEAFISPEVPESYVRTRLDLLAMLREFEARAGSNVRVRINDTKKFSAEAQRAEEQYGIKGQQVASRNRGAMNIEEIYLGVAITCGLDKVVVPFLDRGVPVEYELIRSIATVSQQKRQRIGVVNTDAKLHAEFNMQSMQPGRNELIIDELAKQYDVVRLNADTPITERYDVLLAVQPSSLSPEGLNHLITAIRNGQPTAIFEDPFPYLDPSVTATSQPKRPPGGMMGMNQGPPQPKGDINQLWDLLGLDFPGKKVVWQSYNPYPKIAQFPKEFVFTGQGSGAKEPFSKDDSISSGLQEMLFLFPGSLRQKNTSDLKFQPLVKTGDKTGTVNFDDIMEQSFFGQGQLNPARRQLQTGDEYIMAAHIRGKAPPAPQLPPDHPPLSSGQPSFENMPMSDEGSPLLAQAETPAAEAKAEEAQPAEPKAEAKSEAPAAPAAEAKTDAAAEAKEPAKPAADAKAAPVPEPEMNVVVVSDIDMLYSAFFALRARGEDPDSEVNLAVDNVAFVLNALDVLAGDDRFVELRKRRPVHRTLTKLENWTAASREKATEAREEYMNKFEEGRANAQKELDSQVAKIADRTDLDPLQKRQMMETVRINQEKQLETKTEQLKKERDDMINKSETDLAVEISRVQNQVKWWAVILPALAPLALGIGVFINRRNREREGVAKSRLR